MKSYWRRYLGLALVTMITTGILRSNSTASEAAKLTVRSSVFMNGGSIPAFYTCAGADQSPPLEWNNVPRNARSLALIIDDPDAPAGDFVHWMIYNLSANSTGLAANQPKTARLPSGARQGINDFGHLGYDGPCPPPGSAHHYHFKLYALADSLNLPARSSAADLKRAMRGKLLAVAEMIATFAPVSR